MQRRLSDYSVSLQPSQSNIHKLMVAMDDDQQAKDSLEWVKAAKQIMLDAGEDLFPRGEGTGQCTILAP